MWARSQGVDLDRGQIVGFSTVQRGLIAFGAVLALAGVLLGLQQIHVGLDFCGSAFFGTRDNQFAGFDQCQAVRESHRFLIELVIALGLATSSAGYFSSERWVHGKGRKALAKAQGEERAEV